MKDSNFRYISFDKFPDCCEMCTHYLMDPDDFGVFYCEISGKEFVEAKDLDILFAEHKGIRARRNGFCDNFKRNVYEEVEESK